jgi:ribosome-binding factor A
MPREFSRSQRVADALRKELSTLIQFQLRDPRLTMVSITDVEVSRDMAYARVFYTSLSADTDEEMKECTAVLNKAAGFLRSQVARGNTMRTTPQLKFIYDVSVDRGRELSRLIDEAVSSDRDLGLRDADGDGG